MATAPAEPAQALATPATAPVGAVVRQEFGSQSLARTAETAASMVAAQAQAIVQARYVMALQRPRDMDDVRMKILREVERPGFAAVAWYRKPIGKGVEGFSARFTETVARCMGNLMEEAPVVFEDESKRIIRITVTDLESNLTKFRDTIIEKTVERSSLNDGRVALSVRKNSQGNATYTVPATEDELLGKEGSIGSKIRRNLILQMLPGDIQDAARQRILAIRAGDMAKDPDAARRKILDAFGALNIPPSDLKRYLGHEVATASPAELSELRDLYSSIHEGEATWAEALSAKTDKPEAEDKKPGTVAELKEKLGKGKPNCAHPGVPPSKVAATPKGKAVVCLDCGEEFPGEAEEREGPDDKAAVQAIAAAAEKPKQGRLG